MKTIKWFTDTETTGLLKQLDQILSFSVVMEKGSETEHSYEKAVLLKPNILPNPNALLINHINPFVNSWKSTALTEFEAYLHIKHILNQYKQSGKRVVMIAYNLEFDDIMYSDLFKRYGDNLNNYISVRFDPLTTAKRLIEKGIIKTKEVQTTYSKSYQTSKLEEVYKALGYDSSSFKAHTALDDTLMLQMTTHGLYFLATDKKLDDLDTDPESYQVNQICHLICDDNKIGLHKKYVKVLFNDIEKERLIVLDQDATLNSNAEAAVRVMGYSEILDEFVVDEKERNKFEDYYQLNKTVITEALTSLMLKKEVKKKEIIDFSEIDALAQKIIASKNINETISRLSPIEKNLLPIAEEYACGKYLEGWTDKLKGKDYLTKSEEIELPLDIKIICDPIGLYKMSQGEELLLSTEKKTLIQEKILELLATTKEDEEYKKIVKMIPSIASFKNTKHPKNLLDEFENAKADVFTGDDKFKKDLITDLLAYYKKKAPETFKDIGLPSFKLDLSSLLKK